MLAPLLLFKWFGFLAPKSEKYPTLYVIFPFILSCYFHVLLFINEVNIADVIC